MLSKIPFDLFSLLGNVFFVFFPLAHPLRTHSCFPWIFGRPSTALLASGVLCNAHVQAFYAKVHLALLCHGPKLVLDGPSNLYNPPSCSPITIASSIIFPLGHMRTWPSTNETLIPFASNADMDRIFFFKQYILHFHRLSRFYLVGGFTTTFYGVSFSTLS